MGQKMPKNAEFGVCCFAAQLFESPICVRCLCDSIYLAVKRRRKQGYVLKEEITVIDATGLRQVTIRNRGFHDDNGFGHSESTFKS